MGRLSRPVLRLVGNVVMVLTVAVFLAFVITSIFLGWKINPVLGYAMSPAFNVGDVAVIETVDLRSISVGDVIMYNSPQDGEPTAHRVVEIEVTDHGLVFRTKADSNENIDTYVLHPEDITGRYKFQIPMLGHVAIFVKSPLGLSVLIGVPGLIITTFEVSRLVTALIPGERRRRKARWTTGLKDTDWIR